MTFKKENFSVTAISVTAIERHEAMMLHEGYNSLFKEGFIEGIARLENSLRNNEKYFTAAQAIIISLEIAKLIEDAK